MFPREEIIKRKLTKSGTSYFKAAFKLPRMGLSQKSVCLPFLKEYCIRRIQRSKEHGFEVSLKYTKLCFKKISKEETFMEEVITLLDLLLTAPSTRMKWMPFFLISDMYVSI